MSWLTVLQVAVLVIIVAALLLYPALDAWRDVAAIRSAADPEAARDESPRFMPPRPPEGRPA